jgi:hypothetical protein
MTEPGAMAHQLMRSYAEGVVDGLKLADKIAGELIRVLDGVDQETLVVLAGLRDRLKTAWAEVPMPEIPTR